MSNMHENCLIVRSSKSFYILFQIGVFCIFGKMTNVKSEYVSKDVLLPICYLVKGQSQI